MAKIQYILLNLCRYAIKIYFLGVIRNFKFQLSTPEFVVYILLVERNSMIQGKNRLIQPYYFLPLPKEIHNIKTITRVYSHIPIK